MDARLVAWARAVKARQRRRAGRSLPTLWLFTDPARMPDLVAVVSALPAGLCGVVFRHDGVPGREIELRRIARLCRARRLVLVAAGSARDVPPGVGQHLRGGRGPARRQHDRRRSILTSSVHDAADMVRALRAGADAVFISPVFATASHPGAPTLGPVRWSALARRNVMPPIVSWLALGGIDGRTARRLPRPAAGAGAIGALLG